MYDNIKQIEKDIPRTQSSHPTFMNSRFQNVLKDVLVKYC
jgi:hypothetical protein